MNLLAKIFSNRGEQVSPNSPTWYRKGEIRVGGSKKSTQRLVKSNLDNVYAIENNIYLYDREERELIRSIRLSIIIMKMVYNLAPNKVEADDNPVRSLLGLVIIDTNLPLKSYLNKLDKIAKNEATIFAEKFGFDCIETLWRKWLRFGKELDEEDVKLGKYGQAFENKLQILLKKFALGSAPYQTELEKTNNKIIKKETPRFYVTQMYVTGLIPCGCYAEACEMASELSPATAKDDKEGLVQIYH
jgi:hypothetical protein